LVRSNWRSSIPTTRSLRCIGSWGSTIGSLWFFISFWRGDGSARIQAPSGLQRLFDMLWCGELKNAHFLRHCCALVLWFEFWNQLGHKPAGLLRIEIAGLLWDINK
jgi:hypothetical protein